MRRWLLSADGAFAIRVSDILDLDVMTAATGCQVVAHWNYGDSVANVSLFYGTEAACKVFLAALVADLNGEGSDAS